MFIGHLMMVLTNLLYFMKNLLIFLNTLPSTGHTYICDDFKVLEKCTKNLFGHSRLAFNNHQSNIDC